MILTGEPSGDFHAGPLIKALKQLRPDIRISGIGGPAMADQGAEIFFPIEKLSAMGLIQVVKQLGTIKQAFSILKKQLRNNRPDMVVLIDYPGFNLKAAQYIKENYTIPVCYYIAPKVWAWNAARLKKIKRYVDHLALILPFEPPIYKKENIPATYVGNPLLDEYPQKFSTGSVTKPDQPIIGLLPGSRKSEIDSLLPTMLDAAVKIKNKRKQAQFLISSASDIHHGRIQQILSCHPIYQRKDACQIIRDRPIGIFNRADMLIAASGTVTLEAALCMVPTILIYKMSPLAFGLAKLLVKVKYAGLANLIAGQEVMPELIQMDATPEKISQTSFSMLASLADHKRRLELVRQRLGTPGAPARTARLILSLMNQTNNLGS